VFDDSVLAGVYRNRHPRRWPRLWYAAWIRPTKRARSVMFGFYLVESFSFRVVMAEAALALTP
jgi:hypothetical protein